MNQEEEKLEEEYLRMVEEIEADVPYSATEAHIRQCWKKESMISKFPT